MVIEGCSFGPKIVVDEQSIKDNATYEKDLEECRTLALQYSNTEGKIASTLLGAGLAVGAAAAVLATAGLFLLPLGIAAAAGGGGALGGGFTKSDETNAQEGI